MRVHVRKKKVIKKYTSLIITMMIVLMLHLLTVFSQASHLGFRILSARCQVIHSCLCRLQR